jgi:flagellar protein FliL
VPRVLPWLATLAALLLAAGTATVSAASGETFNPYVALEPPVVVNLANPRRAEYLQIAIELQVESAEDARVVNSHMPVIRDTLILFFGGRESAELRPVPNREELRAEALAALREALSARTGRPAVDGLYFTSFLIQ